MSQPVLSVENLVVEIGGARVVDGVSFALAPGETLGIVGESGSGKTLTALSLLRLLPPGARVANGRILLAGEDLLAASEARIRALRGRGIAMVFQEPMSALNPVLTIGTQLVDVLVRQRALGRAEARSVALDALARVGIAAPERRLADRPHQLSGGMRQRVLIAMALACEPQVLVADEPTTALDVTTQAQVLELVVRLQSELGFGVMLITHDLAVVAETCARTLVMQTGRIVEHGATESLIACPTHPYTAGLLASTLRIEHAAGAAVMNAPVLRVENLRKDFAVRGGVLGRPIARLPAVVDVSFAIAPGRTLGLVGESGCGKSTLGRTIVRLYEPTAGEIYLDDERITHLSAREMRPHRRTVQMIFQDPHASLDPRYTVGRTLREPLDVHAIGPSGERGERVRELLGVVGLGPEMVERHPHELSGGQRQRVGIARAIALEPKLVVADEPVSSLDVTVRAQVLDLLSSLQRERGIAWLFISHDLAVVRHVSHEVAVMYLGRIVEHAQTDAVYHTPRHPYTRALLSAVPQIAMPGVAISGMRERVVLGGEVPSALTPPSGCAFHPRCPRAMAICARVDPPEVDVGAPGAPHRVRCHLYTEPGKEATGSVSPG